MTWKYYLNIHHPVSNGRLHSRFWVNPPKHVSWCSPLELLFAWLCLERAPWHPMLSFREGREVVDKQGAWFLRVRVYGATPLFTDRGWGNLPRDERFVLWGSEAPLMWRCILWVHLNAPISCVLVHDGITGRVIQVHPSVSLHDTGRDKT